MKVNKNFLCLYLQMTSFEHTRSPHEEQRMQCAVIACEVPYGEAPSSTGVDRLKVPCSRTFFCSRQCSK